MMHELYKEAFTDVDDDRFLFLKAKMQRESR
jgi:hypothetical protein